MKCPDCPLITAHDDADPETEDVEDSEGSQEITVTVRRIRVCSDCGTELKEAQLEITGTPTFTGPTDKNGKQKFKDYDPDHCPHRKGDEAGPCEFEWEAPDAENTDRVQTKDRHGKPIKRSRYMTTYYGVSVTVEGTCQRCGATASFSGEDDIPASGMDELV
jgi:hypothetical protein